MWYYALSTVLELDFLGLLFFTTYSSMTLNKLLKFLSLSWVLVKMQW